MFGLKQMVAYEHQNGVTAYNEPGALVTPDLWKLYQQILGAEDTPFYSYFLVDGRGYIDSGVPAGGGDCRRRKDRRRAPPRQGLLLPEPDQALRRRRDHLAAHADEGRLPRADGSRPGHHGEWMTTPANLEERAQGLLGRRLPAPRPCQRRRGLEVLLDVLERRMSENPRANHRTVIVHFANSTEEQVARIARLGAIVSANPYYTVGFADKYGEVRPRPAARRCHGALRLGAEATHPALLPLRPADGPQRPAVPRLVRRQPRHPHRPRRRTGAAHRVEDALRAVTIEAAYSWQKENELGSIAPGKIANFTVLEQDPLAVEPMKLKDVPIWGTVFEGRLFPITRRATSGATQSSDGPAVAR